MTKDQIQAEALAVLLPLDRGSAGVTMGGGKTLIGLKHMNNNYNDYCEFLVVVPKVSIQQEWVSQAEKHGLAHLIPHITFTTYRSLNKQRHDYDVVYLDECHSLLFSHAGWLNDFKSKIIGLTGTPPKTDKSEKGKMVDKYCPVVYTYDTDSAVEDNILNDYRIIIHMVDLEVKKTLEVIKPNNRWFTSEKANYEYWTARIDNAESAKETQIMRIMRMKAMMEFPSKDLKAKSILNNTNNKILLFANTQDQADKFGIHSFHSKNEHSDVNLNAFKL